MSPYSHKSVIIVIILLILSMGCQSALPFGGAQATSTPDAAMRAAADAFVEQNKFGAGFTGNDKFGILAVHENGEQLVAMTESSNGRVKKVTGAVLSIRDKGSFIVYNGQDGLPEKAIYQDYIYLYSNYTDTTVDIAQVAPDGSIQIQRGVTLDAQKLSELKAFYRQSKMKMARPSALFENMTLRDGLKAASLSIAVASCVAAIILTGPLGFVCAGAILSVWAAWDPDNELITTLDSAVSKFGCISPFITGGSLGMDNCVQTVL